MLAKIKNLLNSSSLGDRLMALGGIALLFNSAIAILFFAISNQIIIGGIVAGTLTVATGYWLHQSEKRNGDE